MVQKGHLVHGNHGMMGIGKTAQGGAAHMDSTSPSCRSKWGGRNQAMPILIRTLPTGRTPPIPITVEKTSLLIGEFFWVSVVVFGIFYLVFTIRDGVD